MIKEQRQDLSPTLLQGLRCLRGSAPTTSLVAAAAEALQLNSGRVYTGTSNILTFVDFDFGTTSTYCIGFAVSCLFCFIALLYLAR